MNAADRSLVQILARTRVPALDLGVLYLIVDAEIEALERVAGPPTGAVETFVHGTLPTVISVLRPIGSVTSIAERRTLADAAVTLAADDWRQLSEHRLLRVNDGTNQHSTWGQQVDVTYDPQIDAQLRIRIAADLTVLSAKFKTLKRQQIGEALRIEDGDYSARRAELLNQLTEGRAAVIA